MLASSVSRSLHILMLQWQQIVVNCKAVTNQIAYNYELYFAEEPTLQPIQKNLTMATPYDTQLTDNIVQYVAQSQDDVLGVLHKWRLFTNMQHFCLLPSTRTTLKYPNSVSTPIFPGEADCPFILYDLNCPGTDQSFSHPSEHHPATSTSDICNIWSLYHHFSNILQRLIQSVSSLCLTCPKQFNLSIWITKLTAAKPNSSLNSSFSWRPKYQSISVLLNFHSPYWTLLIYCLFVQ